MDIATVSISQTCNERQVNCQVNNEATDCFILTSKSKGYLFAIVTTMINYDDAD